MATQLHNTSWHDSNRGVAYFLSIYAFLYLVVVYLSKRLHECPRVAKFLPEAGMVILVGLIAGGFAHLVANNSAEMAGDVAESVLSFDSTVFFIVFLPPIIFNSGYHLHRQLLLRYFTPICLLAFLGTMISMVLVAMILHGICQVIEFSPTFNELLAFGALISATDPVSTLAVFSAKKVDPQLFYLLSGESLLNDAVGLVLFEAFAHLVELDSLNGGDTALVDAIAQVLLDVALNFGGSLILGTVLGLLTALCLKHIDLRPTPLLELSAYALIMYAPFVIAEICRLSGIVTVLFTGLSARKYAEPNLSKFTSESSDTIFRLVAHVTETLIFLELGLSVITILRHGFDIIFVTSALLACLVSRALNVYPIVLSHNLFQRIRYGVLPSSVPKGAQVEEQKEFRESNVSTEKNNDCDCDIKDGEQDAPYIQSQDDTETQRDFAPNESNDTYIPRRTTHFLFLSGLRGAVSYGLVKMFPDDNGNKVIFEVTTMLIVLVTTFVFGGFTDVALERLKIPIGVDENLYMESLQTVVDSDRKCDSSKMRNQTGWWHRFESKRINPFVLRDYVPPEIEGGDFVYHQEQPIEVQVDHSSSEEQQRLRWSIFDFGR